jgi:ligand-binding sensor domain-containing protein
MGAAVFVGTYGGGVVRRDPASRARMGDLTDGGTWRAFPETATLKINTGCLVAAGGRVYAGSDGHGLWALGTSEDRFVRLDVLLPSPRVTALLVDGDTLWIGTDEGLMRVPLQKAASG